MGVGLVCVLPGVNFIGRNSFNETGACLCWMAGNGNFFIGLRTWFFFVLEENGMDLKGTCPARTVAQNIKRIKNLSKLEVLGGYRKAFWNNYFCNIC